MDTTKCEPTSTWANLQSIVYMALILSKWATSCWSWWWKSKNGLRRCQNRACHPHPWSSVNSLSTLYTNSRYLAPALMVYPPPITRCPGLSSSTNISPLVSRWWTFAYLDCPSPITPLPFLPLSFCECDARPRIIDPNEHWNLYLGALTLYILGRAICFFLSSKRDRCRRRGMGSWAVVAFAMTPWRSSEWEWDERSRKDTRPSSWMVIHPHHRFTAGTFLPWRRLTRTKILTPLYG